MKLPQFIRTYLLKRRERRIREAWVRWYIAHPCKASHLEPWSDKDYS